MAISPPGKWFHTQNALHNNNFSWREQKIMKKNFKAWKAWVQALGSFCQAKAWRLQGSVSSLVLYTENLNYAA